MTPGPDPRTSAQGQAPPRRIPFLRSLRGRLIVVLTLFVGFTALVLSVTDYRYVRGMLRDSVEQQLKIRAQGLTEVLLAHVWQQQERVQLVASRTRLRSLLRQYLDGEIEETPFRRETARILLDARDSIDSFRAIFVAGVDGSVLTATDDALVGQVVLSEPEFVAGLERATLGVPTPTEQGLRALLSAPARTNDGRLLGVVLVDVDAEAMRRGLTAIPSKFASAQVRVAADENGEIRYLFPIEPTESDIGPQEDPAMRAALAGGAGFAAVDDFRGRDVLVAYQNVGYRGWGLVTQVDADEAYGAIAQLSAVVAAVGILVAVLGVLVGIRFAGKFTGPILELAGIASKVGAGDLSRRAPTRSNDEVGVMATAFNAMTEGLERHQSHLEDLVRERTQVIEERTAQLERSHHQLAELCRLLEQQADVMDRDLHRAELIQRSLLPDEPPRLPDFCVQTLYRPGRNIGGDLYDVIKFGERHLALVVADASGHGVSAAMLAVLFKHRLRLLGEGAGAPCRPAEALARLNTALREEIVAPGVFFTCIYCLLDTGTRELAIASAGHPPALWLRHDGPVERIARTGPALGLYGEAAFEERTIELARGDRVLLYTDGLFDVGDGGAPDVQMIAKTLRAVDSRRGGLEQVLLAVSGGREREDRDDVTMLLLEAEAGESHFSDRADDVALDVEPNEQPPKVTFAEGEDASFLCIEGRVTWTLGEALLEAAVKVIEAGRPLVIDLGECVYLDSTMLGTLHEVVHRADAAAVPVSLQRVGPALLDAFAEVAMDAVTAHVAEEPDPVPAERDPLPVPQTDLRRQRARLLKAHEELAALSPDNEAQFAGVVEALRAEVDGE